MTDLAAPRGRIDFASAAARTRLARRYRREARFKSYGIIGLAIAALFLVVLFANILGQGLPAFWQHSLRVEVTLSRDAVDPQGSGDPVELAKADYQKLVRDAVLAKLPFVTSRARSEAIDRPAVERRRRCFAPRGGRPAGPGRPDGDRRCAALR